MADYQEYRRRVLRKRWRRRFMATALLLLLLLVGAIGMLWKSFIDGDVITNIKWIM